MSESQSDEPQVLSDLDEDAPENQSPERTRVEQERKLSDDSEGPGPEDLGDQAGAPGTEAQAEEAQQETDQQKEQQDGAEETPSRR